MSVTQMCIRDRDYGVEKVLAGELDATFIYPTGGDRVMQIAMDILNKRDFHRETILGTSVVDHDNALILSLIHIWVAFSEPSSFRRWLPEPSAASACYVCWLRW